MFLFVVGQPQRQRDLQAFGTELVGGQPEGFQQRGDRAVINRFRPWSPVRWAQRSAQQPQRVLAMVAADGAELIEDLGLELTPHTLIARVDRVEVFALGIRAHNADFFR